MNVYDMVAEEAAADHRNWLSDEYESDFDPSVATATKTHRMGETIRCECNALVAVDIDIDGEYIDCPDCGNFGYLW